MSTKIYNGYRIPMMSFPELIEFTNKVRDTINPIVRDYVGKLITRTAFLEMDKAKMGLPKSKYIVENKHYENYLSAANFMVMDEIMKSKKSNERNGLFDISFSLCLMPGKDKIYVILYTEQENLRIAWEGIEGVESYSYWNNSDPPEGMRSGQGYEEWENRGKEWSFAVGENYIPSKNGLIVEGFDDFFVFKFEELVPFFPTLEERISMLKEVALVVFFNEAKKEEIKSLLEQQKHVEIFDLKIDFKRSEEGQNFLSTTEQSAKEKLILNPTIDDFKI